MKNWKEKSLWEKSPPEQEWWNPERSPPAPGRQRAVPIAACPVRQPEPRERSRRSPWFQKTGINLCRDQSNIVGCKIWICKRNRQRPWSFFPITAAWKFNFFIPSLNKNARYIPNRKTGIAANQNTRIFLKQQKLRMIYIKVKINDAKITYQNPLKKSSSPDQKTIPCHSLLWRIPFHG